MLATQMAAGPHPSWLMEHMLDNVIKDSLSVDTVKNIA